MLGWTLQTAPPPAKCEILELPTTATIADVKKRYRNLVKTMHPDRGGDAAQFELMRRGSVVNGNSMSAVERETRCGVKVVISDRPLASFVAGEEGP
jgi:hypothetical protein